MHMLLMWSIWVQADASDSPMTINSNSADRPSILHNLCSRRYHCTIEKATDLYISKLTVTTIIFISFCNGWSQHCEGSERIITLPNLLFLAYGWILLPLLLCSQAIVCFMAYFGSLLCTSNELTTLGLAYVLLYAIVKNLRTNKSGSGNQQISMLQPILQQRKRSGWRERGGDFATKFKQAFWIHIHFASGSSSPILWFKYNLFG